MITSLAGRLESDELVISTGTDGIDGKWKGAGGWIYGDMGDAREALDALDKNDTGNFLLENGLDIVSGPTGNNLLDIFIYLRLQG
jgi:glycerate-2-kinase